jgi:hypothetical protein
LSRDQITARVEEIMVDFTGATGFEPVNAHPKRYLWTDAFAVCNLLELFRRTHEGRWKERALRLVDQVHHTLGRHRDDDPRKGWISGLPEGELHPTKGGLRIGKPLPERKPGEPYNDQLEWDQDGQYFHYLTKWMHALNRVSRVTGDQKYNQWAIELAQAAYAGFTYVHPSGTGSRMCWKMSIDLSRPLVPSMGQHDPLDGFITFSELQLAAALDFGQSPRMYLSSEIAGITAICRGLGMATDDPLGTGGLLVDSLRVAGLRNRTGGGYGGLLESILEAALPGVRSFAHSDTIKLPPEHRLAFRELGLAIGLEGTRRLIGLMDENPANFRGMNNLVQKIRAIHAYAPLGEAIVEFWLDPRSRMVDTWTDHKEINEVMLATSLAPDGFLAI